MTKFRNAPNPERARAMHALRSSSAASPHADPRPRALSLVQMREGIEELATPDESWDVSTDGHVYNGERCIYCNVNVYDQIIYGPFDCVPHAPLAYRTETPRG